MTIEWQDNMSIDGGVIDADHKALIVLVNKVRGLRSQIDPSVMPALLKELTAYVEEHFARESAILADIHYPHKSEHEAKHDKLVEYASDMAKKLSKPLTRDSRVELLEDLDRTLSSWLMNHILVDDMAFASRLMSIKNMGAE